MKNKIIALTMALMLSIMSAVAVPMSSKAETIDSYTKLLTLIFGDNGEWQTWENIGANADKVIQDVLRLVCGVFINETQAHWIYEHLATLLGVDPDTFMEENFSLDGNDIKCTGLGRRAFRGLAESCINQNIGMYRYKSLVINDNILNINRQNLTSTQWGYIKDFFNRYQEDYYILFGLSPDIRYSTDFVSFIYFNYVYLVPKDSIRYGFARYDFYDNYRGYNLAYDVTGQDSIRFTMYGTTLYTDLDNHYEYVRRIQFTDFVNAYENGVELEFANYGTRFYFPYNESHGIVTLPKIYNNGQMPFLQSDYYLASEPCIFVTYNSQDFITFYKDRNTYLASQYEVPQYFVGDTYYNYDYSSDSTTTIGTQTLYDNCPTYNTISNYYGDYYEQTGTAPSGDIIYNYINNYYYGDNGGGSGGSGGSSGGIFDWLGDLGEVLGSLISGLGNLIVNLLSGLTSVFDNIANVLPESMSTFFSTLFSWLPEEWITLITLSMYLGIVYGLVKLIRG